MPLRVAVHAEANWLAGINKGDFSKFLTLVTNDSLPINDYLFGYFLQQFAFFAFRQMFLVSRLIDSPVMNGLLLVPSNRAFADFEAR
jgi:hypothetical protein